MRLKLLVLFMLSVLIPTALLAYFGLRAVRSEKKIVEDSIQARYSAMVNVVEGEVKRAIADMPADLVGNTRYLESVLLGEAAIFKDEVKILNRNGRDISGPARSFTADAGKKEKEEPLLLHPIKGLPYTIAVYERHPLLTAKLKERKKALLLYIALIGFSAFTILCGGFFTLGALFQEWRRAELKSEFVSHLSHDLRRPLTSIRMFSEMLRDNRLPSEDKKQHYYKIITEESERLTHLANNILDFSRIERGRKKYSFHNEDISRIAQDTVNHFREHIMGENRRLEFNLDKDIPAIKIDGDAISQALMNLLTNADKFSPPDKEIAVNLRKRKREVVIEVIDHGIGINRGEQKRVFNKFYRASQKGIAETEGSGLGLTLVKYIANAHKGRVEVESEEGKGSKFSLILPV
ncbi:MAG: HAMP domain-containing histidine kinase [Omnitrophica bacterium]|nr:HAMP domain-containing histidine kinase [Candidatus Omnitrophota bacterium]